MTREAAARLLGVSTGASAAEVRDAYRRAVKRDHADVGTRGEADAARVERMRRIVEARDVLLAPPPASGVLALQVAGPPAWRGGEIEISLPDNRVGVIDVPPAVMLGALLPVTIVGGGELRAQVMIIDASPWSRGLTLEDGFDMRAALEVSLHDVFVGASVRVPTPWGVGDVRLPAGSLAPVRLRGYGLRPEGREAGHLIFELKPMFPPADDAVVAMGLRPHRRPPRLVG